MHADKGFPLGMILFNGQLPSTIGMFFSDSRSCFRKTRSLESCTSETMYAFLDSSLCGLPSGECRLTFA